MTLRSYALLAAALCAAPPLGAQTLDSALAVYYRNDIQGAGPLFERLVVERPDDPDLRVWLGNAYLRLDDPYTALGMARQALEMRPCHSAAHDLAAATYIRWLYTDPGGPDSLWTHVSRATECDPADGNVWLNYWMAGTLRRDTAAERLAQRRLAETGFIPEPPMERARWILRSAPPGAVIITGGDWDYFPLGVAQTAEGLRPDVELVQQALLEFPWYVRWMSRRAGLPMPRQVIDLADDEWGEVPPEEGPLPQAAVAAWAQAGWDDGARPLVIAVTADVEWVKPVAWPRLEGAVYTLHPLPSDTTQAANVDLAAVLASLRHLDVARLAGPAVHSTDRSPVRRTEGHPANVLMWFAEYWAVSMHEAGDAAGAREALAWGDRVLATGAVSPDRVARFAELRAQLQNPPQP